MTATPPPQSAPAEAPEPPSTTAPAVPGAPVVKKTERPHPVTPLIRGWLIFVAIAIAWGRELIPDGEKTGSTPATCAGSCRCSARRAARRRRRLLHLVLHPLRHRRRRAADRDRWVFKKSKKIPFERLQSVDIIQPLAARHLRAGRAAAGGRRRRQHDQAPLPDPPPGLPAAGLPAHPRPRGTDQRAVWATRRPPASSPTSASADQPLVTVPPQRLVFGLLLSSEWLISVAMLIVGVVVDGRLRRRPVRPGPADPAGHRRGHHDQPPGDLDVQLHPGRVPARPADHPRPDQPDQPVGPDQPHPGGPDRQPLLWKRHRLVPGRRRHRRLRPVRRRGQREPGHQRAAAGGHPRRGRPGPEPGPARVRPGRDRAAPATPARPLAALVRLLDPALRLGRPGHDHRARLDDPRARHRAARQDPVGPHRAGPAAAPAPAGRRAHRHTQGTGERGRPPARRPGRPRADPDPAGPGPRRPGGRPQRRPVAQVVDDHAGEAELLATFGTSRDRLLGSGGESEVFALDEQRVLRLYRARHEAAKPTSRAAAGALRSWAAADIGIEVPLILEAGELDGPDVHHRPAVLRPPLLAVAGPGRAERAPSRPCAGSCDAVDRLQQLPSPLTRLRPAGRPGRPGPVRHAGRARPQHAGRAGRAQPGPADPRPARRRGGLGPAAGRPGRAHDVAGAGARRHLPAQRVSQLRSDRAGGHRHRRLQPAHRARRPDDGRHRRGAPSSSSSRTPTPPRTPCGWRPWPSSGSGRRRATGSTSTARFYGFYFSDAYEFDPALYGWCLRQLTADLRRHTADRRVEGNPQRCREAHSTSRTRVCSIDRWLRRCHRSTLSTHGDRDGWGRTPRSPAWRRDLDRLEPVAPDVPGEVPPGDPPALVELDHLVQDLVRQRRSASSSRTSRPATAAPACPAAPSHGAGSVDQRVPGRAGQQLEDVGGGGRDDPGGSRSRWSWARRSWAQCVQRPRIPQSPQSR